MDPRGKTFIAVAYCVAVCIAPASAWLRFAALGALLGAATAAARVPFRILVLRLLPLGGIGAAAALTAWLGGSPEAAARLTIRLLLISGAALVLTMSTPATTLVAVLAQARMPATVVALLLLTARYMHVLESEAWRAARAWQARSVGPFRVRHAVGLGRIATSLVRRSVERADRIALAMVARGFTGTLPCAPLPRAGAGQMLTGLGIGAALIVIGAWR